MIRSTPGRRTHMHSRSFDVQVLVDDDAVELSNWMPGVKAGTCWRDLKFPAEVGKATGLSAPLVGVTHQDRGHFLRPNGNRIEDGLHLALPPQAREVEVHANHTNRLLAHQ